MIKLSIVMDDFGVDEGARMTSQVVCDPRDAKIGVRVFRRIATDGESGIIHYGTKFVLVE
jgi:uncharacterized OB-fold protein